jgi:putative inorganic carbon (HCO3(-)) transporter
MSTAVYVRRWRSAALALAAVVAVAALALAAATHGSQPDRVFEYACGAVVLIGAAYVIWSIDPAWTISAALVLTVFSGNWQAIGLPGFPFLPDRLLLGAGIVALLIRAPGAIARPVFQRRAVHWLLAFTAAYAIIDAFVAHTLTTNEGFFKLADRFGVIPFVLFGVAPLIYQTERQRRILLGCMLGLGLYLGLIALFEITGPTGLVVPHYMLNPNVGVGEANSVGVVVNRARGPFLDGISNGAAMFDCAVAAAVALTCWRTPWARALAGVVILLSALGCLFTLQRTVWLAVVVGVLGAMLSSPRLRRYIIPAVVSGAVLVGLAFALIPGLDQRAGARLNDQFTVWDRQNLTAAGLRMLDARPLLGFGWDRVPAAEGPYLIQPSTYPLTAEGRFIHNTFLSNAVELGVIGALLWLIAMGAALISPLLRRGPPAWRSSLVAVAGFWAVTAWFYPLPLAFPLTFLMLWAGVVDGTGSPVTPSPGLLPYLSRARSAALNPAIAEGAR